MALIGIMVLLALLMVVESLIRGFVLATLWSWFVVPIGGPEISIPIAIGISIIVGMLTNHGAKVEEKELGSAIGGAIVGPFVVLGIAWVVTLFM